MNFKNVTTDTWVRTITLIIVSINQLFLTLFDVQLIPIGEEEVYTAISTIALIIVSIIAFWENNSFTKKAQEADNYMKRLM